MKPSFADIAYFAATVAEEAQDLLDHPCSETTSVLGAIFNNPLPAGLEDQLANGEYAGLHWEDKDGGVSLIVPGVGRWTAPDHLNGAGSEEYTFIPE